MLGTAGAYPICIQLHERNLIHMQAIGSMVLIPAIVWTDVNPTTRTQVGIRRVLKFEKNICFSATGSRTERVVVHILHIVVFVLVSSKLFEVGWGGLQ